MNRRVEPGGEWCHLRASGLGIGEDNHPSIWTLVGGPLLYDGQQVNEGALLLIDERKIGTSWYAGRTLHCLIRVRDVCGVVVDEKAAAMKREERDAYASSADQVYLADVRDGLMVAAGDVRLFVPAEMIFALGFKR